MIYANTETSTLEIDHLGFTLRTLLGAANKAAREMPLYRRKWNIAYNGVYIGKIQLAQSDRLKG